MIQDPPGERTAAKRKMSASQTRRRRRNSRSEILFYIIGNVVSYDTRPSGGAHCGEKENVCFADSPQAEKFAEQNSFLKEIT